jgi:SAM-dependent methyltransferase
VNWNSGYVTDVEYTHGYYRELCPSQLRLACISAGFAPPAEKPMSYLELGYGQGVAINIHAAANEGAFWGTDFNPSQAAHARTLARASGKDAVLLDDSFAELAARPDLPEFDVIALHGIWTWVSDENGQIILDLIRRKLRVGGLLYISYNCLPGWAPAMPLRHLVKLHADLAGSEASGVLGKLDGGLRFAKEIVDSGARYFQANPNVGELLEKISGMPRIYLAHEYLNEHWRALPFSAVAEALAEAKLTFACSARLTDQVDSLNLTPEAQELLAGISHPVLRESVRDYLVNQNFRRDVFIKGPRQLTQLEQVELLRGESFVLTVPPRDVPDKVKGSLGEVTVPKKIHDPVVEVLAEEGYAPKTLQQLSSHAKLRSLQFSQIVQALIVLTGTGYVQLAQSGSADVRNQCRALNSYICNRARSSSDIEFLASPVTGGGINVSRFHQLFLLGMQQHKLKTQAELANFAWTILSLQGQRLVRDGKTIEEPADNLAELAGMAEHFLTGSVPILRVLDVA